MSAMHKHQMTPSLEPVSPAVAPNPAEPQVHQEDQAALIVVPVKAVGKVAVQQVPSRTGAVAAETLNSTSWAQVLGQDLKRRRAVLLLFSTTAGDFVLVSRQRGGGGVQWPANVPLVLEHGDQLYAQVPTGQTAAVLTVITETWAD